MKNHVDMTHLRKQPIFFDSKSKANIDNTPNTVLISIMALHKQIFFLFKILMLLEQEKFGNSSMLHKNIQ